MDKETAVLDRYTEGARERQAALCCPVDYSDELLKRLPREIIDKDYGCGDPSRYVRSGDVVLDLGSGSGKVCYMAAQLVGRHGRVIGVDMNDSMLSLARKYQAEMSAKLGNDRVQFLKGRIQDLSLDISTMEDWLVSNPVTDQISLARLEAWQREQRNKSPLIGDKSVDLVISNCVLNLVRDEEKQQLVNEIYRVVKPGGRIAISDIVSDADVPEKLKDDAALWSGCVAGAFQEQEIIRMFSEAGFVGICLDKWSDMPWQVIEDIEFRSVTLTAHKKADETCLDKGHAVIYRGPFSFVMDDEGHEFPRGERMAVCERTFRLLMEGVYAEAFIGITPAETREGIQWCAKPGTRRDVKETRGGRISQPDKTGNCC